MDWEFDTNAFLTYNNPEFKKQCKLRKIDVDELNTGWVKQVPLDKVEDEPEEPDDEDEKDEEEEEDEFFPTKKKDEPEKPKADEEDDDEEWDWDEEDLTEEKKESEAKPEISAEDISKLFADISDTPNRDKINAELDKADTGVKPKIKLNIDPTKPKTLKFNIKKPNEPK